MTKQWILLAATTILAATAAGRTIPVATPAVDSRSSGLVAIYVKPFSPDARRLSVRLERVAALREDGSAVPLTLVVKDISGSSSSGQRLLAWGALPPGRYTGFAIGASSASLDGADGARTLAVAKEPRPSPFAFSAGAGRATLLTAELDFRASTEPDDQFAPVFGMAVPSKLATGLVGAVASRSMGAVLLFDKVSGQPSALVVVGKNPQGLALDAARYRLYVALGGDDAIATVDLLEASVLAKFQLRSGDDPVSLALSPDGRTLLCANSGTSTVSVLDASSTALVERRRAETGNGPRYVAVDPSGTRAWVFNALDDSIGVIALSSGVLVGKVRSGGGPIRGDFGRGGARLYVIHANSGYLDVVDVATLAVVQRVNVGPGASAIKVDSKSGRIYLGFVNSSRVDVFDPNLLLPVDTITAKGGAGHLTIDGEGNNLCIATPSKGEVSLVRIVGKSVAARLEVPAPVEVLLLGGR